MHSPILAIIATSRCDPSRFRENLTRPGRLATHVHVPAIDPVTDGGKKLLHAFVAHFLIELGTEASARLSQATSATAYSHVHAHDKAAIEKQTEHKDATEHVKKLVGHFSERIARANFNSGEDANNKESNLITPAGIKSYIQREIMAQSERVRQLHLAANTIGDGESEMN